MRCLSCNEETRSVELKVFNKIVLCGSCYALAEKAETDVDRCFERAKQLTKNWLSQHIMRGGLLLGGDGLGRETAAGSDGLRGGAEDAQERSGPAFQSLLHEAAVSGLRSAAGSTDGGVPDVSPGDDPEAVPR